MRPAALTSIAFAMLTGAAVLVAQQAAPPSDAGSDLIREAQQKMREGQEGDAVALARRAVAAAPRSYQANNQLGALLDLAGHYQEARDAFAKAAESAPTADNKARALRAIAISYGFEQDCSGAAKYEEPLYRQYVAAGDFYTAGEVANELARLCLDAGKIDDAERWYRAGTDAGLREPGIKDERKDLWQFRLDHALARIAAKRGNKAEAARHVETARALLDRGNMPAQQKEYFPYLVGYVALAGGDYQEALRNLQQANQNDVYVLGLTAQAYEGLGQVDKAVEYYRKVMAATIHNPTAAAARPLARQKLAQLRR